MSQLRLPVEEFTTPNPLTASENETIDNLTHMMKDEGIRHIPIMRNKHVVGIISDRDLRVVSGLDASEKTLLRAGDIMVSDPVTVSANDSLDEVAFRMSQDKIGSVIVNDENDNLMGIFTVTDALNALVEITRSGSEEED